MNDKNRAMTNSELIARITMLEQLVKKISSSSQPCKIPIHRVGGRIDYIYPCDIVMVVASDSMAYITLTNGESIGTPRNVKFYQQMVECDPAFFRISKQCLVNVDHVASFNLAERIIKVNTGNELRVSRRASPVFNEYMIDLAERKNRIQNKSTILQSR